MGVPKDLAECLLKNVEERRGTKPTAVVEAVSIRGKSPVLFTIDVDPMGAPRMNKSDAWKKRPVVLRYMEYKDAIRAACIRNNYKLHGLLGLTFHVQVPQSWSFKKRQQAIGMPHTSKPDIDNMIKGFMDSFDGGDQHVHTITATKVWASKGSIIVT